MVKFSIYLNRHAFLMILFSGKNYSKTYKFYINLKNKNIKQYWRNTVLSGQYSCLEYSCNVFKTLQILSYLFENRIFRYKAWRSRFSQQWVNPSPAEPGYTLPLQTVYMQISWLLKKPTDLDLHCLPLSM